MDLNTYFNILAVLLLLLTISCQISGSARFYVKSAFLYLFLALDSLLIVPFGLLHFRQFHRTCLYAGARRHWAAHVLGLRWSIECQQEVDKRKSYIVVCNHQSAIDVLSMMNIWPHLGHTVATAKNELKYLGTFGLALYLCGTIFVDRMSSEKGRRAINEASKFAKEQGTSIWIFPEGTRNRRRDRSMLPFKKGAFHMAIDAGLPILPVVISEYDFFNSAERRFDSGEIRIKVLKPIDTNGLSKENLDELINLTRDTMISELQTISNNNGKKNN